MPKIISRIKGGLGNQLFCYAAARRLAHASNSDLVLDSYSGFIRDDLYKREFSLDSFNIPFRKATYTELMHPFERPRRGIAKWISSKKKFENRSYIEEVDGVFDKRLLTLKPKNDLYLDGLWQDKRYFSDIEDIIRNDLDIRINVSERNRTLANAIIQDQSIVLHVRWFDKKDDSTKNMSMNYYQNAIHKIEQLVPNPHFILFSDDVAASMQKLQLSKRRFTLVDWNVQKGGEIYDLWLMSLCKHFILANSTFSWWGAWISNSNGIKIIPSSMPSLGQGQIIWNRETQQWDMDI